MIWVVLFVILGAVSLVAVLSGLIAAWRSRRALVVMHLVALVLVIVAYAMGHMDLIGRISLAAAMLLEAIAWFGVRHDLPARSIVAGSQSGSASPMFAAEAIYESQIPVTAEPIYDDQHPAPAERLETDEASVVAQVTDHDADPDSNREAATAVDAGDTSSFISEPASAQLTDPAPSLQKHATGDTEICLRTIALLARKYHVTLSVLLASMKRAGIRQARLVEPADGHVPAYIVIDSLKVGLDVFEEPVDRHRVESALAQSGIDGADADAVREHAAYIAIDVAYDQQTARPDAVVIALRAQAALMEFAPVIAVVWPEAANLILASDAADHIDASIEDTGAVTKACVSERRFELDGQNAGLIVFDSLGLGAFGLPDAQVVIAESHECQGVDALRELTRHFLLQGCDLPDGGRHRLGDGSSWRVSYTRSAFDPDREVVQVRPDTDNPTAD